MGGIAGLWCVNIGHGRHEMAEVMAEQAIQLAYYNTFGGSTSAPAAELAAKLARLLGRSIMFFMALAALF